MNFENSFKNKVVTTTVEEIKKSVPNSPRRSTSTLTCPVLNKSPIKPTRNGSMFSLNLYDSDQSTTIRAVCFNEDIFPKIQSKKPMIFSLSRLNNPSGTKKPWNWCLTTRQKSHSHPSKLQLNNASLLFRKY